MRNAVHQLEQTRLSTAAARLARDLAQKNLEAEERKFELGVQTIFFVLEAQTQLAQAEQALLRAEIDYQRARIAFDRSTATASSSPTPCRNRPRGQALGPRLEVGSRECAAALETELRRSE